MEQTAESQIPGAKKTVNQNARNLKTVAAGTGRKTGYPDSRLQWPMSHGSAGVMCTIYRKDFTEVPFLRNWINHFLEEEVVIDE